jgi:putative flippase GtrA
MEKIMIKQFFKHQAFLKYALTGAVVTALELWLLYALVDLNGWWYLYASSLSFFIGLVLSFFLRKFIVFSNYDWSALPRQLFFYSMVWVVDIILNAGLMYLLVDCLILSYILSQIISNLFLGIFGFIFNKLVTFKKLRHAHDLQHHQLLEEMKK